MLKKVFLGIGANLGDRESNLKEALSMIEESIGTIVVSSSVYETEPWGFQSENEFLNMVIQVQTDLGPSGLLGRILMIEAHLGRIRDEGQYSSRIIDIDILLYDDEVIDKISLKIPHPRIPERKFVLVPLCEIVPDLVHPVLKKSLTSLLHQCQDSAKVKLYKKQQA